MTTRIETAMLAGGCFWGMQDWLRRYPGVLATRVGYTGGDVPNATYRNHGTHAEAIEVVFDPRQIAYRQILEIFFQIHDPTTVNRQGNDIGASYRSAIFYSGAEQQRIAEDTVADVDASGLWPGKVVTEIAAAGPFWEAEPEHQNYLERIPDGYTCHFIRPEWTLPRRGDGASGIAGTASASAYHPISCEFHDLLEAHATTRKQVQVRFHDGEGVQERNAAIVDVYAREGAEYLVLNTGEAVRLDRLIEVGNARLAGF